MEKQFAAMKIPDTSGHTAEHRLTRTASFSELPSARRFFMEEHYQSGSSPGLIRQYSCEQIFNKNLNTKETKVSEILQLGAAAHKKTWKTVAPLSRTPYLNLTNHGSNAMTKMQNPTKMDVEYMDIDDDGFKKPHVPTLTKTNSTNVNDSNLFAIANDTVPISLITKQVETDALVNTNSNAINNVALSNVPDAKKVESDQTGVQKNDFKVSEYLEAKKKFRPLIPNKAKKESKGVNYQRIILFLLLPVSIIFISTLVNQNSSGEISHISSVNFTPMINDLQNNIFGQEKAISVLKKYLETDICFKYILLAGNTGVGKSYTIDIMKRYFPISKVFEYFSPIDASLNAYKYSFPPGSLIIVENLKETDARNMLSFAQTIQRNKDCVIFIVVYKTDAVDSTEYLTYVNWTKTGLKDEYGIEAEIICYKKLNEQTLEKCIEHAAIESKIKLNQRQIELIKQNLLEYDSGCKRAYSQVQLIGRE